MMDLEQANISRRFSRITEDDVKRAAIPFLREFYHNRFSISKDKLGYSFDNVSAKGYVADVLVKFEKPDGSEFLCACEATSLDKIDEVKYRVNHPYLWWDATAFGAVCAAFAYGYYYWQDPGRLVSMGFAGNAGLLFGVAMVAGLLWFFLLGGWSKYRYIYAIEQFARYFADEQWVLIAEDVFLSPVDPYYRELVKQCKYHGFGLAIVDAEKKVRKVSDPSRMGIYGKDRDAAQWLKDTQAYHFLEKKMRDVYSSKPASGARALWNKMARPVWHYVLSPLYKRSGLHLEDSALAAGDQFNRFMSGQFTQKVVTLSAILLTSVFVALTIERKDIMDAEAEAAARNENLLQKEERRRAAENEEIAVTDYTDYSAQSGVSRAYNPVLDTMRFRPEPDEIARPSGAPSPAPATSARSLESASNYSSAPPASRAPTPCSRLKGESGWRIRDNTFSTMDFARERIAQLQKVGLSAFAAPQYCSDLGGKGVVVWIDEVYISQEAAQERAESVNQLLSRAGMARKGVLAQRIGK